MGAAERITVLQPDAAPAAQRPARRTFAVGASLLREGVVAPDEMVAALSHRGRQAGRLPDVLRARGLVVERDLLGVDARNHGIRVVDLDSALPDPRLIDAVGVQDCLRHGLVPWQRVGDVTIVATSRPEEFRRLRPMLEARLGPVAAGIASSRAILAAIHARRGDQLARAAETRVPEAESCRSWPRLHRSPRAMACLGVILASLALAPLASGLAALAFAVFSLACLTVLKIAATLATLRAPDRAAEPVSDAIPPVVSIIVALYREGDIAPRLVRRLARLDYPVERLDVILAVEAEDSVTLDALARAELPPWMRVVIVPEGQVKTKPRALNHALDHARGAIIGVYDAEDAPEPDQLRKVVARFQRSGPDVACLQGMLDYYNPRTNWLSRCFTIEYAGWFRLLLPGLARLGLVVPLGGTTLFFRRDVLDSLGAWDAHNVTEDADLGIRLARHGYRTELIETVTMEEANCRPLPWIKQRSRWIKGYMMTWVVHMRTPRQLWRQLGPRGFLGFQVLFLGTIAQFLLAPLLWSFMILTFGLPHPIAAALPAAAIWAIVGIFLLSEATNILVGALGLGRTSHGLSLLWVLTLKLYHPLASLAAYKGLLELATRPFYWDKTTHGLFDHAVGSRQVGAL
ncbi:glycosyltransferase [Rhodobacter calidifons]|uniref:Glycosyltransferase n=1 Tax=Rhodobacter calidifons TaxID=2715277 RepID=A0ABX0G8U3_9RHOB|nr:glycosyltransferase [Rhodobacter calidifons]NHB77702.1 glycosyltransferase [Rhodobacter calidifons]